VKWERGTDNPDVIDARGRTGGGIRTPHIAGAGVGAAVIIFLVARFLGVDVSGLFGASDTTAPVTQTQQGNAPPKGTDADAELKDFVSFVMKDVQDSFTAVFKRSGKTYERAKLVIFNAEIDTGCGRSSAAIGPFYCPPDRSAYIDLSFYRELKDRFGAPGDFAQAYVLAHEIGHHVQNLLGVEQNKSNLAKSHSRNENSVRIELQADCFAGVWGHEAQGRKLLEVGDLEEAITAAQAIGDDRLEKDAGMEVNPETFTHGTSAQRVKWFRRGFDSGDLKACDTFSVDP
jgi:hypothetical protein